MWIWALVQEDPLENEMTTQSSILAWEIPRTEEPGGLQSTGLQSQTQLSTHTYNCSLILLSFDIKFDNTVGERVILFFKYLDGKTYLCPMCAKKALEE